MSMRINGLKRLAILLWALSASAVQAQGLSIDIVNGTPSALPIAVVPFAYEGAVVPPETDVAEIMRNDFNRSGKFRGLSKADIIEFPTRQSEVKFATWNLLKQAYLVVGRVHNGSNGELTVEYELFDVAKQQSLLPGKSISGQRSDMRGLAHRIADDVYEKILGIRGAFWTRVAYITASGNGNNMNYALMVADSDGYGPQTVVKSHEPLLSPAWSPEGSKLAYVSFERGNSAIYIQDISTGSRQLVSANKGINGGPSFSPDGNRLALTLSYGGNPDIYIMDLATKHTTQITKHFAIDVEATWMPDGQSLIFTSDRSGKPQLYQASVNGGDATRISFQGEYNATSSIVNDGRGVKIAMAQGGGNVYRIAVLDRTSGESKVISPGSLDEHPSFAPNGSMLIYAATEGPRGVLYAISADGLVRQRLILADGDVREPMWSPYRKH